MNALPLDHQEAAFLAQFRTLTAGQQGVLLRLAATGGNGRQRAHTRLYGN